MFFSNNLTEDLICSKGRATPMTQSHLMAYLRSVKRRQGAAGSQFLPVNKRGGGVKQLSMHMYALQSYMEDGQDLLWLNEVKVYCNI